MLTVCVVWAEAGADPTAIPMPAVNSTDAKATAPRNKMRRRIHQVLCPPSPWLRETVRTDAPLSPRLVPRVAGTTEVAVVTTYSVKSQLGGVKSRPKAVARPNSAVQ